MHKDVESILFSKEELAKKVKELGAKITEDYKDKKPVVVGMLKGSSVFMCDLVREIDLDCEIEFLAVSSYGKSTKTSGQVRVVMDLYTPINNKDIIIIEDIVDSGVTLSYIKSLLMQRNPASIKICSLLNKQSRRITDLQADYVGFEIEDEFVVGYGLDYAEKYRNLPYVGILKRSVYEK